jgi:reactive intermediate/imine deaminase
VAETIDHGVLPLLNTFPTRPEDPEKSLLLNRIVVRVAEDYDIPLVNLNRALEPLPHHGVDPNDTIHLSVPADERVDAFTETNLQSGFTVRNLVTLQALEAVLEAAGSGLEKVLKTTVFLKDMADFPRMNEVYGRYFGAALPARSTVQAAKLPRDVQVEVFRVEARPEPGSTDGGAARPASWRMAVLLRDVSAERSLVRAKDELVSGVRHALRSGGLEELGAVLEAIRASGALEYARAQARAESRTACEALEALPRSNYRDYLLQLADFAVTRTF